MNKALLLEKYIKVAVKKALQEQEEQQQRAEKAMYFIHRFPGLKKTLEELMSPSFGRYITDISLVAPKPTTFNVGLINNQDFTMYYTGKDAFILKIAGKKYTPTNIGELERASQAITDLLELRYAIIDSKEETTTQRDMSLKQDLEDPNLSLPTTPEEEKLPSPEAPPIK